MFLSIIVPIYNTLPKFIDECIQSIVNAKINVEYETIIINDGSTNQETLNKIRELENNYTVIHQENKGLAETRNIGIQYAKGIFVLPLDSDDKLYPTINNIISKIQENPNFDIYYCNYKIFDGYEKDIITKAAFDKLEMIYLNQIATCSFIKKTVWKKIGGYDSTYKTMEDWDFWIRCAAQNVKFKKIDEFIYYYRIVLNGESMYQKTLSLIPQYHKKSLQKISFVQISKEDIGNYFISQLKSKKRRIMYLLIYLIAPKFFNRFLKKKKFWR